MLRNGLEVDVVQHEKGSHLVIRLGITEEYLKSNEETAEIPDRYLLLALRIGSEVVEVIREIEENGKRP